MLKYYFHEKIALTLSSFILTNYFLLNFSSPPILIKINFLIFLIFVFIFYFKNIFDNPFLKIFFLVLILISLGSPTFEWDPRSIWLFHAKRIFYEGNIFIVSDNYANFAHNAYPKIAPAFASSLATLIGHWNEVFPKLAFLLMFLPPLILAYAIFKKTEYLIFFSIIFFTIGKFLFSGWMDGLVAVYFGFSALLIYILTIEEQDSFKKNKILIYIAFCFFTTLTLIKNEGVVLLLIIFIATFLLNLITGKLRKKFYILFFLSLSLLPIIAWKSFCFYNDVGYIEYYNIDILSKLIPRLYNLKSYELVSYFLLLNEKFLISLTFFIFSVFINWNKKLFNFVIISSIMYLLILAFIFLSTPYDLYWQLNSAAARVVRSVSFLLSFFALYNIKNKINY
jgi:hypothetical protein